MGNYEENIRQNDGLKSAVVLGKEYTASPERSAVIEGFEPFYRADKSRSQRIPGSGLGLAVVKMILDKHGGKIEVVSELNQGSTFKIYLPV